MSDALPIQSHSPEIAPTHAWNGRPGEEHAEGRVVPTAYLRWCGLFSRLMALVLLLLVLPAIVLAAVLVRCTSRGPVIYRQVRLGLGRCPFVLYKIRTMTIDAENGSGPVWAQVNDPRVTRVGRVLRAIGWDELPQLFNIIRGEMAFIGPRPERPEIAESLIASIPDYYGRVAVRPGITGLAQINLPADVELDDVRRKLQLDLEYIRRANPLLDARIILATAPRLIGVRTARVARLLGVGRAFDEPGATTAPRPRPTRFTRRRYYGWRRLAPGAMRQ